VVQEALAEAQRRWATVVEFDKPGAWVRRIALNRASIAVADVADVMECSEGTVKTHLSRARAQLAERYLAESGDGRDARHPSSRRRPHGRRPAPSWRQDAGRYRGCPAPLLAARVGVRPPVAGSCR
jgi:hypothetical protein